MHATHHPIFVILSLLIAVLGSWTALDLFRKVRTHVGQTKLIWLAIAALAMGLSIWSMHFVAMLGFDPGSAVQYDPALTLASLVLAFGATGSAFFFVSRENGQSFDVFIAGAAMGAGICLMHYVGMAALRTAVSVGYDPLLVGLSFLIAIVASTAALLAAGRDSSFRWRAAAALMLGAAIVGMHYTAMAALRLTPTGETAAHHSGAPPYMLAVSVATGTLLILLLALMASLYDQRGNVLSALEAGGVGYWEFDIRTQALHVSPRGKEIIGIKANHPLNYEQFSARLHPEEQAKRTELLANALRTGSDYDAEYRLADEDRWVNVRGRLVASGRGTAHRMVGVVLDVTDRKLAFNAVSESERRQKILIDELNHRVKNTLATIQSIATLTSRRAPSLEDFRKSFEARLLALSATHNALTRQNWDQVLLRDLFEHELAPYAEERFRLLGPDVPLGPGQALSLGMVFHELATNAAKYGALSVIGGCVKVAWSVETSDTGSALRVDWLECDGPPVRPPTGRGFGSRLIAMSVETTGGKADLRYAPGGFECTLEVPLTKAVKFNPFSAATSG